MTRQNAVRDYGGVSADDRRDDRRRRLIAAGRRTWGASGVADIGVRSVCRDADLAHRYFYESFANRDEFLVAIADEVRAELVAILVEASAQTGGGIEDRLRAALTAFLAAVVADPPIMRIMTSDVFGVAGLENRRGETLDLLAEVILSHLEDLRTPTVPQFSDDARRELERAARFVVGGCNRLIETWLVERDTTLEALVDTCTRLCMATAAGAVG